MSSEKRKRPSPADAARELELERAKSKALRDLIFGVAEAVGVGMIKGLLAAPKATAPEAETKALHLGHRCELQQFAHLSLCDCPCSSCAKARGGAPPTHAEPGGKR